MSLAYQDEASTPCHLSFFFKWIIDLTEMIYILWVIWVSLYACDALMKAEACIKTDIRSSLHIVKVLFRALCSLPHHQLHLISSQTGTLRVKGSYLHWLSLCLVLMLAQQKPHPYNKCEVLSECVCVCTLVGMCGRVWRRGRSEIPSFRLW